ncbi:MAG TPA: hypothetical protein PLE26_00420 [Candidatus Paceibacterota bacterium]|nr:hypothetical protein [Candidatus Paceibacterota bacterium]HQB57019.1 hypothetical protein [Candidatus Paceibacterota bacterium]
MKKQHLLTLIVLLFMGTIVNAQVHHKVDVEVADINISANTITGKIFCQMKLETSFLQKTENTWEKKVFWYQETLNPEDCSSFWFHVNKGDRNKGVLSIFDGDYIETGLLEVQLYGRTLLSTDIRHKKTKPSTK